MSDYAACHFGGCREDPLQVRDQAMAFLDQHTLSPTPDNYAVAFDYIAKRTDGLVSDLERKLARSGQADQHFLNDLFERYFLAQSDSSIEGPVSELRNFLSRLLQGMQYAGTGTQEFGKVLNAQLTELQKNPAAGNVHRIVETLVGATEKAVETNQRLDRQMQAVQQEFGELRDELENAQKQASLDGMTGLMNRRTLNDKLDEVVETSKVSAAPCSFLMLDIDHFKRFNDSFGHLAGDEVIRRVASKVQDCMRDTGLAGRYGGEEFAVLLPNTDIRDAVTLANTINEAVGKLVLVRRASRERLPRITVSAGVSTVRGEDTVETLVDRADQALYQAKKSGRNRVYSERELGREDRGVSA